MTLNSLDRNFLLGAYVADAASLGLHWIYDTEHLAKLALDGRPLEFREPDPAAYEGVKSYFAHPNRHAGDLSHYGESALVMADTLAELEQYDREAYLANFRAFFSPEHGYAGYLDKATRGTLENLAAGHGTTGVDDDQLSATAKLPPLVLTHREDPEVLSLAEDAAAATNENPIARQGARIVANVMRQALQGAELLTCLEAGLVEATGNMREKLLRALAWNDFTPALASAEFGAACPLEQALPLSYALLKNATDYESLIRGNILAGGDSCGRAMFLGAVGGALMSVPESLVQKLSPALQERLA
jgi:ADP-ribosylglycohydrolase